jgi:hypothetical protein
VAVLGVAGAESSKPRFGEREPTGGAMAEDRQPPGNAVDRDEDIGVLAMPDTFFGLLEAIRRRPGGVYRPEVAAGVLRLA